MKKYTFSIPVLWEVSSFVEVKASSLEEACEIAQDADLPEATEVSYIDGSFEVNYDVAEYYNEDVLETIKVDRTPKKNLPLLIGQLKHDMAKKRFEERLKNG